MDDYPQPQSGYPKAMENDPVEAINRLITEEPRMDYIHRQTGKDLLKERMTGRTDYNREMEDLESFSSRMGRR